MATGHRTRKFRNQTPERSRITEKAPREFDPIAKRRNAVAVILSLTLLLTALVFSHSFSNKFLIFDDSKNILQNEPIKAINAQNVKTFFTKPLMGMYSPLVYLSYAVDFRIGALDVAVYHATNLLLHLLNVSLVLLIVISLTGSVTTSVVITALFALHPINVAAVVPLSVRSSLLYAFFYLAAYLAYLSYVRTQNYMRLGLSFVLFFFSVLSKSAAVVFPLLLILTDFYCRRGRSRKVIIEKVPFLATSFIFGVVSLLMRDDVTTMSHLLHYSMVERLCVAAYGLVFYACKLIVPVALSTYYSWPARVAGHLPLSVYLAPVAVLVIVWLAVRMKALRGLFMFGSLFVLIHIFLVLKVIPLGLEFAADRYLYLPSIGLFMIVAEACRHANKTIQKTGIACFTAVVLLFSVLSYGRIADWKDDMTFYTRILEQNPDNAMAHNDLGCVLGDDHRNGEAIQQFSEAMRLDPSLVQPRINLAKALIIQGKPIEGIHEFMEVLRLDPSNAKVHAYLGLALVNQGRVKEAIDHLSESVRFDPTVVETHNNLGGALASQGSIEEAITQYRFALAINPAWPETRNNLGSALFHQGQIDEAITQFTEAIRINPNFVDAYRNLGLARIQQKRPDDAIHEFLEALRIDPSHKDTHFNVAILLANKGEIIKAIQHLEMAIKLDPNDQDIRGARDELLRSLKK